MAGLDVDNLRLTDFLDLPTLQEIQDNFAAVANVKATITDAQGNLITQPTPTKEFLHRQLAIADAEEKQDGPQREGREYVAPIMVGQQRLGTIRMSPDGKTGGLDEMLTKIADFYDDEVQAMTEALTSLIEPLLIAFLGVVIGGMVVALYMPIFTLATAVQGAK